MKQAICDLKSVTPYSQSKHIDPVQFPKEPKELDRNYEKRIWRERCHYLADGTVFIPPMSFALSIKEAAQFDPQKIPGKGQQTYTKHFVAGVLVADPLLLPVKKDEIEGEWLFVPSDGKSGGAKRVWKCFPRVLEWSGSVTYYILDDLITEEIFTSTLQLAGVVVGIGRFRPPHKGYYGRYAIENIDWRES